ncbi:MAG: class I SAM-dependent methyltransferase [Dehalococcoidia bacterium]|nr:class I SAM-dependent methyltransferase [Dehalococcoidia bacterium]
MAAARYIDYDPATGKFTVSPEQATVLLDTRSPYDMGGAFLYSQASIRQVPALMEAFRNGGGVPFGDFGPEIVEAIEGLFQAGYETAVAAAWIPAVPGLHERLSNGATVAEVGCGAGQCLVPVAKAYPNSRFVGFDIDGPSLERARKKASAAGVAGCATFEAVPAEELPADARFDLVMAFNCIHDMSDPRGALRGVRGALAEDGVFLWSEANASDQLEDNLTPMGRTLYGASTMHCMTVSLADGGEGLGTVVGPDQARALGEEAGFTRFERLPVEHPYHQVFVLQR